MNYENCRATPLAYAVLKLADYYGCSVEDLLTKKISQKGNRILNSNQKKLKQMIREEESSISDQEFLHPLPSISI